MLSHILWDILNYKVPIWCKQCARKRVKSLQNHSKEEREKVLAGVLNHIDLEESLTGKIMVVFGTSYWDSQKIIHVDSVNEKKNE